MDEPDQTNAPLAEADIAPEFRDPYEDDYRALAEADFTPEFCRRLYREADCSADEAARRIAHRCFSTRYESDRQRHLSWNTVRHWIRDGVRRANNGMGVELSRPSEPERVNRIDDLLDRANVPLEAIGAIKSAKLKAYGAFYKGEDENGRPTTVKVPLYSTTIDITPPNPDFPLVQPAPSTILYAEPPRILRRTRVEVIISDLQIGFLRDQRNDALEPIHDPLAIDVAQQITGAIGPERLVFVGDIADLAPFSRWQKHPEYRGTMQPAIDATHEILGTFIAAAGEDCERVVIGSNHDHRIERSVLEWNLEGLGLRRAGDPPDGWPVFSLGFLARFDDLGLQWSGHYPGGEFYLLDNLVVMHAPPKSKEFRASVIHGHTHHITRDTQVTHGAEELQKRRYTEFVYDIGCLCRVGVTDDKFRLLITHTPSDRGRTDWAQGIAVVSIVEASGSRPTFHSVEQVSIIDGLANFGGQTFQAHVLAEVA